MRRALSFLLLWAVCVTLQTQPGFTAERLPNVLLILIDDMGWADLECYGSQFHETPNINRLAQQGVRFSDFYAAGAVCSPTRASIQSGQYQARLEITDFIPGHKRPFAPLTVPRVADHLPLEIVTPAEALKHAGYRTGYFGKWHLGKEGQEPDSQGYDISLVSGGGHFAPGFRTTPPTEIPKGVYLADFLTDQTINFIRANEDRPFFAMLSHQAVHIPLQAKEELIAKYEAKPKPSTGVNNPVYAAMVQHVDESVGRLMETLDDLNLSNDTVVIFTSDNGGLYSSASKDSTIVCSNAPLRDEKGSLYEGGIRVPLIVRWPGVAAAGAVCSEPVISVDFWPTLAEISGATGFDHQIIDGVSILTLLKDPQSELDRDAIYFHYPHYHHSRPAGAIRSGNWKLIEFFEDGKLELFHLSEDLSEEKELLTAEGISESDREAHHQRAAAMQAQLHAWQKSVDAKMPSPNPDHDPARELELGKSGNAKNKKKSVQGK